MTTIKRDMASSDITITFVEKKKKEGSKYTNTKRQKIKLPNNKAPEKKETLTVEDDEPTMPDKAVRSRSGRVLKPVVRYEPVENVNDDFSDAESISSDDSEC